MQQLDDVIENDVIENERDARLKWAIAVVSQDAEPDRIGVAAQVLLSACNDDKLDAERYRRLAWMVEFGCWSVNQHEIIDQMCTSGTSMDDKADMDSWLDKSEMIKEAEICAKALRLIASDRAR